MTAKLYRILIIMSMLISFSACSDDKAPIDANENFISSFDLSVKNASGEDNVYAGEIIGEQITVTVPYNVDLAGATAIVSYTASAKIMPDPATIQDWDSKQVFIVTSYNGDSREYTYKIIRSEITQREDVVLKSMSDLTHFRESGISVIEGNLTIGTDISENNQITSLDGIGNLKEVKGVIYLNDNISTSDFAGFNSLTNAGGLCLGNMTEFSKASIEMLTFANLEHLGGDLIIKNDNISYIDFPKLLDVRGDIDVKSNAIKSINLALLSEVGSKLIISTPTEYKDGMSLGEIDKIEFPELVKVRDTLGIYFLSTLKEVSFPKLKETGSIQMPDIALALEKISFPSVEIVNGGVYFSSVRGTGTYGGTINTALKSIDGFEKTEEIKGIYSVLNFGGLESLPKLISLKKAGGFTYGSYIKSIVGILDFRNIEFVTYDGVNPTLTIPSTCDECFTQDDISNVDVVLNAITTKVNFKKVHNFSFKTGEKNITLESLEEIYGNLDIEGGVQVALSIPNLRSVEGYMHIKLPAMAKSLNFPLLEKVGGQLWFDGLYNFGAFKNNFSSLKIVGCNASPVYASTEPVTSYEYTLPMGTLHVRSTIKTFNFPVLERIGGRGLTAYGSNPIKASSLKQVDGTLCIYDSSLSDIGFSGLEKLGGLLFIKNTQISDFSSFAKFITSGQISSENWKVIDCGYNPTFQDMKEGRYTPAE